MRKKETKSYSRKILKYFSTKGLFSRVIVIFCLLYCVRIVEWSINHFNETNMEAPTLITVALGLFGGELLLLCLKRIFAKSDNKSIKEVEGEINNVTTESSVDSTNSEQIFTVSPTEDGTVG